MAEISDELLALEKGFWTGDELYYIRHVDRECLVAFSEMAGAMTNTAIAATVKDAGRWQELNIEPVAVEPSSDVVIITYNVKATRANGEHYAALVSSGYVKRPDGWKMMFHAQTARQAA